MDSDFVFGKYRTKTMTLCVVVLDLMMDLDYVWIGLGYQALYENVMTLLAQ